MRSLNKAGNILLILFSIIAVVFVLQNIRTKQLTSIISSIDRVVTWSQYLNVIADYPMGLGPEGGYYLVRKVPSRPGLELSSFNSFILNQGLITGTETKIDDIISKRIRINRLSKAKSSESFFIDFLCSFGVAGLCLALIFLFTFIKDLKTVMRFSNVNFSILYISLGGTLVYGLFNSFHQGWFFIIFLYVLLLKVKHILVFRQD